MQWLPLCHSPCTVYVDGCRCTTQAGKNELGQRLVQCQTGTESVLCWRKCLFFWWWWGVVSPILSLKLCFMAVQTDRALIMKNMTHSNYVRGDSSQKLSLCKSHDSLEALGRVCEIVPALLHPAALNKSCYSQQHALFFLALNPPLTTTTMHFLNTSLAYIVVLSDTRIYELGHWVWLQSHKVTSWATFSFLFPVIHLRLHYVTVMAQLFSLFILSSLRSLQFCQVSYFGVQSLQLCTAVLYFIDQQGLMTAVCLCLHLTAFSSFAGSWKTREPWSWGWGTSTAWGGRSGAGHLETFILVRISPSC